MLVKPEAGYCWRNQCLTDDNHVVRYLSHQKHTYLRQDTYLRQNIQSSSVIKINSCKIAVSKLKNVKQIQYLGCHSPKTAKPQVTVARQPLCPNMYFEIMSQNKTFEDKCTQTHHNYYIELSEFVSHFLRRQQKSLGNQSLNL